jgi:hypothetical protein
MERQPCVSIKHRGAKKGEQKMGNEIVAAQPQSIIPKGNASTMVAQSREMAEAIGQMQMAKSFPRDVVAARDRILNACTRPRLAETACYTYARGGTEVTGPSIRLAEMLAQNWGNVTFGIRELEQRNGESTCEAFAWDMETNARQTKIFQVPHIRYTRNGAKRLTDPRDIYELVANNGARRLRACILGIIPGDVVEEAVEACDVTLQTKFNVTPERVKGVVDKFAEYGVTPAQIEKRIQCHLAAMKPAQMANLGKIYNSIKDGMSKPEDWFEAEEAKGGSAETPKKAANSLRDALGVKDAAEATPKGADAPQTAKKDARQGDLLDVEDVI